MRHSPGRIRCLTPPAAPAILVCILLLLSATPISQAHSGRCPPKPPTSPDPLTPKQGQPPIRPSSDQDSTTKVPVKIVGHRAYFSRDTFHMRIVQDACLKRLSQSGSVRVSKAADEMNRKQAIDMAKASADTYVLWFELEVDSNYKDRGATSSVPPEYLTVRFQVFTPATAKTKTSGRLYQRPQGAGGIRFPEASGSAIFSLEQSGREMADRVLDTLGVARPPR